MGFAYGICVWDLRMGFAEKNLKNLCKVNTKQ